MVAVAVGSMFASVDVMQQTDRNPAPTLALHGVSCTVCEGALSGASAITPNITLLPPPPWIGNWCWKKVTLPACAGQQLVYKGMPSMTQLTLLMAPAVLDC